MPHNWRTKGFKGPIKHSAKFIKIDLHQDISSRIFRTLGKKETTLLASTERNKLFLFKRPKIRMTSVLSTTAQELRKQWGNVFKILKENDSQARILCNYQWSFRGQWKYFWTSKVPPDLLLLKPLPRNLLEMSFIKMRD